jgi:hypothetical protein
MDKPDNVIIAIQMGSELGLAPMQSLQNIAVINGRPSVWGDAMPGLCRASGMVAYLREWSEGEGDALVWHCETKRRDDPNPVHRSYSVKDAVTAKLWNKASTPWVTNPGRMLQMRARGFCLRDAYPDVLRGLISAEEAQDIPFEATGLQLPPAPTTKAVANTTQRKPQVVNKTAYDTAWLAPLDEPDPAAWLRNLELVMANCVTQEEVTEAAGHTSVRNATRLAPPDVRRRVSELLAEHFKRLAPPAEPEPEPETDTPLDDFAAAQTLAGADKGAAP